MIGLEFIIVRQMKEVPQPVRVASREELSKSYRSREWTMAYVESSGSSGENTWKVTSAGSVT